MHYHSNKLDEALADFNKAIELDENNFEARINRGFTYFDQGNYFPAYEEYTYAININAKNADAYAFRCEVDLALGDKELAIKDIKVAKKLNPKALVKVLRKYSTHWYRYDNSLKTEVVSFILSHIEDKYDSFSKEEKKVINKLKKRV